MPCEPIRRHTCYHLSRKPLKCIKVFVEVENAGWEISYRCVDCRSFPECKKSPRFESVSIQEEAEQSLIDRSIDADIDQRHTISGMPFLVSQPDLKLIPTENLAYKAYKGAS